MRYSISCPWWLKIFIKLVLSKLPLNYFQLKNYIFKHGAMDQADYAYNIFFKHFFYSKKKQDFVSLELGPGDSLSSAIIAKLNGGTSSYLLDSGNYATRDLSVYRKLLEYLKNKGCNSTDLICLNTFEDLVRSCNIHYLTDGYKSLQKIPSNSVDFFWSNAVLEHISYYEFENYFKELRRIIRPDGVGCHTIDLRDHLSNALNNLRFSEKIWESKLMRFSGFYTNRIRFSELMDKFKTTGFEVEIIEKQTWPCMPIKRKNLNSKFLKFSDEDLRVRVFTVKLIPV